MNLVIDTSVIMAVITNEEHKKQLIEMTKGADLIAPPSLHWEIGNAFSAMFRRKRISLEQSRLALAQYSKIPIRFHEVDLYSALEIAEQLELYAYDAYFLSCALNLKASLLTLDQQLISKAKEIHIKVREVV